jgi:hypothetical protein
VAPKGAARDACLACVVDQRTPAAAREQCSACSGADLSAAQRGRCLQCVRRSGAKGTASPTAAAAAARACGACARAGADAGAYSSCLSCFSRPESGPDCGDCLGLGAEHERSRCYRCVAASKLKPPEDAGASPLGSCAACVGAPREPACVACNADPRVLSVAKGWCGACAGLAAGGAAGDKAAASCLDCLRKRLGSGATADEYQKECRIPVR